MASHNRKKTSIKLEEEDVEDDLMSKNQGPEVFNVTGTKKVENKKIKDLRNKVKQLER